MTVPPIVQELIENYERNVDSYHSPSYNETQLRREFIDPLFDEGLGWDISNRAGLPGPYKEVVHEDAIKVGRAHRAPDYSFRLEGKRKFFLEAKKPWINIRQDPKSAYQLRRYAWSSKLPLSILTNFREFAVYDCRIRPRLSDKASRARILYLTFDTYISSWDRIADTFSKEALLKGSLDRFVVSTRNRHGTSEVDQEFLTEIERWRDLLARNIALRNPELSVRDLNFSVQRTIDRIVFLRMCEDRGIERYGQLKTLLNGEGVYQKLIEIFLAADEKYDSGLFHFHEEKGRVESPDELTTEIKIDDRVVGAIIRGLYYPESPYEFSVLPADILGSVYEQFIGRVIRLTPGHQAKIELKPEVKKAGGVYYTPSFIVEYIVERTLGRLIKGKSPKRIEKIRVLDPACGSGSFLLAAYQRLLNYHRDWYVNRGPQKYPKKVYEGRGDRWYLTTQEKKRILLNNIFGVDVDGQAVEVTKLNLLLKVLENESQDTLEQQQKLWRERALPDLARNIKCGNSLIGPDFYKGVQTKLLEEDTEYRINAFDWQSEFPLVMEDGGFDVVIGNPPYVDSEWMTVHLSEWRDYCNQRYKASTGNWDLFCVFIQKASDLCRPAGVSSMIVPNKLGSADYGTGAREVLSSDSRLVSIRDYSRVPVFPVAVYPIVYVAKKAPSPPKEDRSTVKYERMVVSEDAGIQISISKNLDHSRYFGKADQPWPVFGDLGELDLLERLRLAFPRLDSVADVWGAATVSEAYEIKELIEESPNGSSSDLRMSNTGTIDRYHLLWGHKKLRYLGFSFLRPIIPVENQKRLPPKRRQQAENPKIIVAGMAKFLECALDSEGSVLAGKSTSIVTSPLDLRYLLALLNSKLISFFFRSTYGGNRLGGGYYRIGPPQLRSLPVRTIDPEDKEDISRQDRLVNIVEQLMVLNERLFAVKLPDLKTRLQRQIDFADKQVDDVVYELYGLTEEEIRFVEKNS